jgi:hypothetical protein
MGATAAIGAGLSVVGGIAAKAQRDKQAKAQREAIESQAQIDRLNRELQLMSLENQQAAAQRQALLNQAVDDENYLNRQFQLDATQLQNSTALNQAAMEARLANTQAGINQRAGEQQALDQRIAGDANAVNALAQTMNASTEQVQSAINAFAQKPERERQRILLNLMDVSSEDGENKALAMLTELADTGVVGQANKLTALNDEKVNNAEALKAADLQTNAANQALGETSAVAQAANQRYQATTSLLDVDTAGRTNDAATEAERIAIESAYASNKANRSLQQNAQNVTFEANKDVLQQGGKLSEATASAQSKAAGSSGFFDLLSIAGNGVNTYRSLGGNFGFLNSPANTGAIDNTMMDVTNVNGNIG